MRIIRPLVLFARLCVRFRWGLSSPPPNWAKFRFKLLCHTYYTYLLYYTILMGFIPHVRVHTQMPIWSYLDPSRDRDAFGVSNCFLLVLWFAVFEMLVSNSKIGEGGTQECYFNTTEDSTFLHLNVKAVATQAQACRASEFDWYLSGCSHLVKISSEQCDRSQRCYKEDSRGDCRHKRLDDRTTRISFGPLALQRHTADHTKTHSTQTNTNMWTHTHTQTHKTLIHTPTNSQPHQPTIA